MSYENNSPRGGLEIKLKETISDFRELTEFEDAENRRLYYIDWLRVLVVLELKANGYLYNSEYYLKELT